MREVKIRAVREEAAPERVASLLLEEESTDAAFRQFRGLDLELLGGSD